MKGALPLIITACIAALSAPAWADTKPAPKPQKPPIKEEPAPPGTVGSGAISLEDLAKEVQTLQARKYGIVVNYVLPHGWEVVEQGKDPKTGKLRDNMGMYVVLSRRPMPDAKEATDFIYELDVFEKGLTTDLPKDTPADKRAEVRAERLWGFLNGQISLGLKNGWKLKTQKRDIEAKAYGPDSRGKKTMFIPIFYEIPADPKDKASKGAMLYTFTSFEGETVWTMKFLITKGMEDQHGGLIALMLNNAWAVTEEVDKKLREQAPQGPKAN